MGYFNMHPLKDWCRPEHHRAASLSITELYRAAQAHRIWHKNQILVLHPHCPLMGLPAFPMPSSRSLHWTGKARANLPGPRPVSAREGWPIFLTQKSPQMCHIVHLWQSRALVLAQCFLRIEFGQTNPELPVLARHPEWLPKDLSTQLAAMAAAGSLHGGSKWPPAVYASPSAV